MVYDSVNGLLESETVGSTVSTMTYNGFGEAEAITYTDASGVLFEEQHVRDATGQITQTTESNAPGTRVYEYDYDLCAGDDGGSGDLVAQRQPRPPAGPRRLAVAEGRR